MTELDALRIMAKHIDMLHEYIQYLDAGRKPGDDFLNQLESTRQQEKEVREILGDLLTSSR